MRGRNSNEKMGVGKGGRRRKRQTHLPVTAAPIAEKREKRLLVCTFLGVFFLVSKGHLFFSTRNRCGFVFGCGFVLKTSPFPLFFLFFSVSFPPSLPLVHSRSKSGERKRKVGGGKSLKPEKIYIQKRAFHEEEKKGKGKTERDTFSSAPKIKSFFGAPKSQCCSNLSGRRRRHLDMFPFLICIFPNLNETDTSEGEKTKQE